jgi:hypothetical protein
MSEARFVKVTGVAEAVMVHDRWLYAGETRIVHRHFANMALAAMPGSLIVEDLPAGELAPVQAVTIEDSSPVGAPAAEPVTGAAEPAAADETVTDDSEKVVAGRKAQGRRPVQGRKP